MGVDWRLPVLIAARHLRDGLLPGSNAVGSYGLFGRALDSSGVTPSFRKPSADSEHFGLNEPGVGKESLFGNLEARSGIAPAGPRCPAPFSPFDIPLLRGDGEHGGLGP